MGKKDNKNLVRGYTLIEVILYIALVSVMVVVISSFWASVNFSYQRDQALTVTDAEGTYMLQQITQAIRNATGINSPTAGNFASTLSLGMSSASKNPTVFTFSGGNLTITEGVSAPVSLKSNRVKITSLTFTNLTRSSSAGVIRIALTLSYNNTSGISQFNYSETLYASAALR